MGMIKRPIEQRFWEKVDRRNPDECWFWKGIPTRNGYGRIRIDDHDIGAHRLSYILNIGKIPDNYCVCHSCDVRLCVNPNHLFLGTVQDNIDDMNKKGHNIFKIGHKFACGERNGRAILTDEDVKFIRMNPEKQIAKSLAVKFHVAESTIHRVTQGVSWADNPTPPVKRRPGQSRLSIEQVKEICAKSENKTITELGKEYGITPAGIRYCIRKYKSLT